MISFNIPIGAFLHEVDSLVDVKDLLAGLAKAPVFAILIAGIGCLRGLQTQTGASAVGISATRAVVSGDHSAGRRRRHLSRSSTICSTYEHRPMSADPIIRVEHFTAGYEGNVLMRDISFIVKPG